MTTPLSTPNTTRLGALAALILALVHTPAMTQNTPTPAAAGASAATPNATVDPYLWLEEVLGEKPLAWVRERNAESRQVLTVDPHYAALKEPLLAALNSRDQIPYVSRIGDQLYNLWRDSDHPRGLWRRTTLAEYRKATPAWETVLDLDALGKAEKENWVWSGARCLGPKSDLCMLSLSRGGADAVVIREFNLRSKQFVDGGFALPEAKGRVTWIDANHLYVATDFGAGSLTDSGYPRVIKRWQRGTPLGQAVTVFEGQKTDVSVSVSVDHTPGHERTEFSRAPDFFTEKIFVLEGKKPKGAPKPVPMPDDAQLQFWRDQALLELRSELKVGKQVFAKGSLLASPAKPFLAGKPQFTAVFTPTATRSLASYVATQKHLVLSVLDNVASRVQEWQLSSKGQWSSRDVVAPFPGTIGLQGLHDTEIANDPLGEHYLLTYTDFLTPPTLYLAKVGSNEREALKATPSFFDKTGLRVEQRFAKSKDGTSVPYFVVWPKGASANGTNPTLLYGYGGFEISMQPSYSAGRGLGWLTQGGVLVVANIRGGGEFGPGWHQAAIKAHKQRSYDDFIAVAEDLIANKITNPKQLGIQGGSNGGLLVGATFVQRPDLFNAVVCQVPLLDMRRFNQLLAGASWMAEYGNPDVPAEWDVISRYSPYQNVKAGVKYPKVLFTTSTRDDRVHPGHARKMVARMRELGADVLYYENIEGGHGGAADNAQRADLVSMEYSFLWQQLGGKPSEVKHDEHH